MPKTVPNRPISSQTLIFTPKTPLQNPNFVPKPSHSRPKLTHSGNETGTQFNATKLVHKSAPMRALTVVVPPVMPSPFWEGLGVHGVPLESVHVAGLSRLQSSLDAAARIFGYPSPTMTLYSSFRSVESPRWTVEYSYAANSQLPRPDSHRQTLTRTGCDPKPSHSSHPVTLSPVTRSSDHPVIRPLTARIATLPKVFFHPRSCIPPRL